MMWSSREGKEKEANVWISTRELNPWMMEHCSFEAILIVHVCQVHTEHKFSRGRFSNLYHQDRSCLRVCEVMQPGFFHLVAPIFFLPPLFWQNYIWVLKLSWLTFPFQSRTVLKIWEHLLSWTPSLLFQRIIEKKVEETLKNYLAGPPGSRWAQLYQSVGDVFAFVIRY